MILSESDLRHTIFCILKEELTRTDKREIERMIKRQVSKHFKSNVSTEIDRELGKNYFGVRGKINKYVDDEIGKKFKNIGKDKDFDKQSVLVTKRVLSALFSMFHSRKNLISTLNV